MFYEISLKEPLKVDFLVFKIIMFLNYLQVVKKNSNCIDRFFKKSGIIQTLSWPPPSHLVSSWNVSFHSEVGIIIPDLSGGWTEAHRDQANCWWSPRW